MGRAGNNARLNKKKRGEATLKKKKKTQGKSVAQVYTGRRQTPSWENRKRIYKLINK